MAGRALDTLNTRLPLRSCRGSMLRWIDRGGAQFALQQSHFQVWERSAEEEIPDAAGAGKKDWGVVAYGAGSWFGRGRDADVRQARRQALGAQRSENFYYQRALRGCLCGDGGDGQIEEFARHQRVYPGEGDPRF